MQRGAMMMRKQLSWYSKGLPGGATIRSRLSKVHSVADVEREIAAIGRRVIGRDAQLSGPLTVTMPEGMVEFCAPLLAEFARTVANLGSVQPTSYVGAPLGWSMLADALEADPAHRYPDAAAFRSDLDRWLAGEAPQAARGGVADPALYGQ